MERYSRNTLIIIIALEIHSLLSLLLLLCHCLSMDDKRKQANQERNECQATPPLYGNGLLTEMLESFLKLAV